MKPSRRLYVKIDVLMKATFLSFAKTLASTSESGDGCGDDDDIDEDHNDRGDS